MITTIRIEKNLSYENHENIFLSLFLDFEVIYTLTPSFSMHFVPFSWYSCLDIQKVSLSFMMSARTAPPRNTMCFRRGGSSIRILNFQMKKMLLCSKILCVCVCFPQLFIIFHSCFLYFHTPHMHNNTLNNNAFDLAVTNESSIVGSLFSNSHASFFIQSLSIS